MKTLGLIGGISWVSTADYYKYINEGINKHLGWIYFSRCIIHSFSYGEIKNIADAGDFAVLGRQFIAACHNMKAGGAEAIVICANTMHMFADELERETGLPVIHIATATAKAINAQGLTKVGLLGTKPTMQLDFYKQKLAGHGIEALIPGAEDMDFIHNTIFEELGKGIFTEETRRRYLSIMDKLVAMGAQGIILGCTEIPMLVTQADVPVPVFDTTKIHADAAVAFSLGL